MRDYFNYYLHLHRVRKGEAQATDMIVTPAITGVRQSTESTRPRFFQPGVFINKLQSLREVDLPPVAPGSEKMARASADGCAISDDNIDSEVEEVILVRKLGSIYSLRDRRTKVLRQLEMAHVELARRVLAAVSKHKAKFFDTAHALQQLREASTGLIATVLTKDTRMPAGITRMQRLDLLTRALADYVDDAPAQKGETEETVWDVSLRRQRRALNRSILILSRFCINFLESFSTLIKLSRT